MKTKCFFVAFMVLFGSILKAQEGLQFVEHIIQENFGGACTIASADFDGDGDLDVVATSFDGNYISWFENDGTQAFTQHLIIDNFGEATVVDVACIDGDSDIDIIATAQADNKISWFENDGSGNFTEHIITTDFQSAGFVYARDQQRGIDLDINEDGYTDFIATGTDPGNKISWFENDGNQNFTEHLLKDDWYWVRRASSYDIDQDGDMDIFAGGKAGDLIWFENDGAENFSEHYIISDWGWLNAVLAEDINQDGFIDLVATTVVVNEVAWFENDGNQNFTKHVVVDEYNGAFGLVIDDIDKDNDWDILATAWIGGFGSVFENDGNQNFTEHVFCDNGNELLHLFVIDLDGDTDLDILGACYDRSLPELRWWENYQIYLHAIINSDFRTGHIPLTVNFIDSSLSRDEITNWEWDLDGDGNVDSYEQNPQWTYTETGFYTVSLKVTNAEGENKIVLENYIHTFDGESSIRITQKGDYVETISNALLNLTENFTIEACLNPESIPITLTGITVLDKDKLRLYIPGMNFGTIKKNSLVLEYINENGIKVRVCAPENSIKAGVWQHFALSFDYANNQIYMFINGQQLPIVYSGAVTFDIPIGDNSLSDLVIGSDTEKILPLYGCIDELRIWDYSKTKEEILEYMNTSPIGNEEGLILFYNMDEGNGSILLDLTTNNNNGIINECEFWEGVDLSTISDVNEELENNINLPNEYFLFQNYPNAFNPATIIRFAVPEQVKVTLQVYTVLGELVQTLIKDSEYDRGSYEVEFNGSELSSGVYIYKLQAGSFLSSKKMMIVK